MRLSWMGFASRGLFFLLFNLGGLALWGTYRRFKEEIPLGEDRLSQLPDDVLLSILKHLNPKDAATTTALSTRWRHLFALYAASMPSLKLRCDHMFGYDSGHSDSPCYPQKYFQAVDQLLRLNPHPKVPHLEMDFCLGPNFSTQFRQLWSHSISTLGVKSLHLYFNCGRISISPACNLFKFSFDLLSQASSLELLYLYHCIVQPSSGLRLNSLRTLILSTIPLATGQLEGIFSSCLSLNYLKAVHCHLPPTLRIFGSITSVYFDGCSGVVEIDLLATSLRSFEGYFYTEARFYFSSVPMLEHVMIYLGKCGAMQYVFGDFARDLPAQIKSLILSIGRYERKHFPTQMQTFRQLRKLTLLFDLKDISNIVKILHILDACPLLQYLGIEHFVSTRHGGGSFSPPLISLRHTQLKKVAFGGFLGTKVEIGFVIYILNSAMVLEQMFLSSTYRLYHGDGVWVERQSFQLSEGERNKIQQELHGKAISKTAVVIIQ